MIELSSILEVFGQFGLSAVIIGILFWQIFFLQKKLISIIENNTSAMIKQSEATKEVKEALKDCQRSHINIVPEYNR